MLGSAGRYEAAIPKIPEHLLLDKNRYAHNPQAAVVDADNLVTAEQIIDAYVGRLEASMQELVSAADDIGFQGGMPSVALNNGNTHIFKGSAWVALSIAQAAPGQIGTWFTQEQVDQYKLKLKKDARPLAILWYDELGQGRRKLFSVDFYNGNDVLGKEWSPAEHTQTDWHEVLLGFLDEFSIKLLEQQATIIKSDSKDFIYRNESFLLGEDLRYQLVIPEQGVLTDTAYQQSCLTGLACLVARSRLVQHFRELALANSIGYLFAQQAIHTLYPKCQAAHSQFHVANLKKLYAKHGETNPVAKMCMAIDDYMTVFRREIFEINQACETLIRHNGVKEWMATFKDDVELQDSLHIETIDTAASPARADLEALIHRQNISVSEVFQQKLEATLKQQGIVYLDAMQDYIPVILSKLDLVMSSRDLAKHPDEYDFYNKIEPALINGLVKEFQLLANLEAKWRQFEHEIAEKVLPDAEKDFIIRKSSFEYKKFIKNIFFVDAEHDSIMEAAGSLLNSYKT
ncbi:hypothetical protein L1281_001724 [Neisseria sp. HSC-16F19]|nr:hypothetical protein [Neisseria sp. HSC-16F19]MCP2041130.1 hypothetical protein [Neisseria sp. HSC-16F19]